MTKGLNVLFKKVLNRNLRFLRFYVSAPYQLTNQLNFFVLFPRQFYIYIYLDKAWDIKTAHEKRHQIIYFDTEKYRLTTTEKIKKIEDFLDKLDGKKIEERNVIQQIHWILN